MRRTATLGRVGLVLAVVLAGCSFGPVGATPTETVSPAPLPETAALPPGVTEAGVTAPRTLGETHQAALRNRSFTLRSNRTVTAANGTLVSLLNVTVALADDRTYRARVATDGPDAPVLLGRPPARGEYWSNGSVHLRRLSRDGRTTHDRIDPERAFVGSWQFWTTTVAYGGVSTREPAIYYATAFDAIPATVADYRSVDGTTVVRLVGDGARSASFSQLDVDTVGNVSLVAVVDERGIVRSYRLSYVALVDGEAYHVRWRIEHDRIGRTRVDPPAWADRTG